MSAEPAASNVTVPGLQIGAELGRGAYSVVYRCTRDGAEYAVKMALEDLAHRPETLRSFRREAALLACLRHPSLVAVHEAGESDGRPYLVMDLAEGDTLDTLLTRGGGLPVPAVARVGLDIAAALAEAHRRGLVHRDVKPQNIVVGAAGAATLIDFGLTGRTGAHADTAVVGTVLYSAPEQTGMLDRPVDARSDLYCLGVVLYECLAGVAPFTGSTVAEVMRLHASAQPRPLRALRPDLPESVERVVARLLAKDPDDRYQSAADLHDDLARASGLQPPGPAGTRPDTGDGNAARAVESAALQRAWTECRGGQRVVATVSGPAGCGKSHLVTAFLRSAARDAAVCLQAKCAPTDTTPLAALRTALVDHLRALAALTGPQRRAGEDRLRAAAGTDAELLARLHPRLADRLGVLPLPAGADVAEVRFQAAVGRFLSELARLAGGLVLWIDDVQWLGHADRQVLAKLAAEPDPAPVLLVGTTRDESLNLARGAGRHLDIALAPLRLDEVRALMAGYLRGATDDGFVRDVAARSAGSPLAVVEYLRAVLDAGLIRPSWGHYVLDRGALASLDLPEEVIGLILRRVEALSATAAPVLTAAAVLGSPFDPALLPGLVAGSPGDVQAAVAEADAKQLIAPAGDGLWTFLHDRIPEALLSRLAEADRRAAHRRAAQALDAAGAAEDERIYQLAQHSVLGALAAGRRFEITAAAAAKALDALASTEARALFEAAAAAAAEAGVDPDSGFEEGFGVACTRTSRPEDALVHLWRALQRTTEPHRRARILATIADVEFGVRRYDAATAHVQQGLAAVGHPLPANPFGLAMLSVFWFVAGMLCRWDRTGFGRASDRMRESYRIRAKLHVVGARAAFMRREAARTLAHNVWALYPVHRLGPGPEYVVLHTALAPVWAELRRRRAAHRKLTQVAALAEATGNPALSAEVKMYSGVTLELTGEVREAGARLREAMAQGARWMDVSQYQIGAGLLVDNLLRRGYWREAWAFLNPAPGTPGGDFTLPDLGLQRTRIGRSLGHPARGDYQLESDVEPARRSYIYRDLVELAVEAGEWGPDLDAAIAGGDAEGINPALAPLFLRPYWLAKAKGRLEQARSAPPAERVHRLRLARAALKQARAAASVPLLRADLQVLRATEHELHGRFRRALDCLVTAERLGLDRDAPRLRFDILLGRARCLRAMRLTEEARREATLAFGLAGEFGWVARARSVQLEFALAGNGASTASAGSAGADLDRARDSRQLDALLRVGAAAGGQLDPLRVASVALDEIIHILGADRAVLLLAEDHLDDGDPVDRRLSLYAGRTADGEDVRELSGYASTLVERVRSTGEAVVVAGTGEGAALGSHSAVLHDLRSILVAPLPPGIGWDGVVYLDSRLAKGMFVAEHVEILVAIAKQVAVSLHAARAARLKALVVAERRERELAEALREVMAAAESSPDPTQILDRVLAAARRVVQFDAAWALTARRPHTVRVVGIHGAFDAAAVGREVAASPYGELLPAFDGRPVAGSTDLRLPGWRVPTVSWLAVPVVIRSETVCVLVFSSGTVDAYGATQQAIASTLAEQSAVTYENVRLFREVERFATTDALTGLANRRHFLATAEATLDRYDPGARPVSLVMVDVDHFKRVNDTFGHAVGDEVLTEVARRLSASIRAEDFIGRFGGEEFVAVLNGTDAAAALVAERMRNAVAATPIETTGGPLAVTVSVGLTSVAGRPEQSSSLLARADAALYEAKRAGRNRVVSTR